MKFFEKVRTEKKAIKRLIELVKERTNDGKYQLTIIQGNALDKAKELQELLVENGISDNLPIATFGSVIGTHLGEGSIALSYTPLID